MPIFSRKSRPIAPPAAQVPAMNVPDQEIEQRIFEIGERILRRARGHKAGLLSAKFYQDKLMDWSMKDQNFKVQLFRFVDTFPVLTTPETVHEVLVDYLTQPGVKLPPMLGTAVKAGGAAKGLLTRTVSGQITQMAQTFIAGTDAASALPRLRKLWKDDICFSVDLLGEACVSDAEADMYRDKYLDLVENLAVETKDWPGNPTLERDHLGSVPRTNVSIKLSSLCAQFDPIDPDNSIADLMTRVGPILDAARQRGVLINFDMEHFELKDLTLDAFTTACESHEFEAGIAMQAYLRSGPDDARRLAAWAKKSGRVVTVRLVKGAYWDFETIHAEQMGWPCPVWGEKWETDACFEEMTEILLDACPKGVGEGGIKLALGSHNVRSIAHAIEALDRRGLPREAIELQMLHGMADQLKHAAAEMDLRVREYVPVGEMIPGMAYLVRRLLENTSNESWLKAGFLDDATPEALLAAPAHAADTEPARNLQEIAPERHELSVAVEGLGDSRPFFTEAPRDFADHAQHAAFAGAMHAATVMPIEQSATAADATAAVERAAAAFPAWRDTDPVERSRVLIRAANMMRARRDELSALVCKESRKPWREADADVCEAIDFCAYYAREAVQLFERRRLGKFIGELDETWYQPRGVCAVISPWNFPLAICMGMTAAALVTGNTVVVKPAEQSPSIARVMYDIFEAAIREIFPGNPPEQVIQYLAGPGETVGATLVRDPRVAVIAFTGSKAVGLNIIQAAGVTPDEQLHVKRVVCEMGGKNAIIVDSSADLDEAVLGVRYSAFGYAGQKCSACSRCIVVDPEGSEGAHTRIFLERLAGATKALVCGDPTHPGTDVPPVIDAEAAGNIRKFIETAKSEGLTELVGANDFTGDYHADVVPPHVFTGVTPEHTIARQEIFGPVLAVLHASSFTEALEMANGHQYKLTGGVFTRTPTNIERAKREFRVGNLYINRGCTGALVGRQPFGGFGMSGVGSKAGGKDYLLQFVEPRACSENTMRRGFAPEL